jgi:hypothetical protein
MRFSEEELSLLKEADTPNGINLWGGDAKEAAAAGGRDDDRHRHRVATNLDDEVDTKERRSTAVDAGRNGSGKGGSVGNSFESFGASPSLAGRLQVSMRAKKYASIHEYKPVLFQSIGQSTDFLSSLTRPSYLTAGTTTRR